MLGKIHSRAFGRWRICIVVLAAFFLGINGEHGAIAPLATQKAIEQTINGFLLRRVPFAPIGINDSLDFLESLHRNNRFMLAVVKFVVVFDFAGIKDIFDDELNAAVGKCKPTKFMPLG